jgi:hypothetical protein
MLFFVESSYVAYYQGNLCDGAHQTLFWKFFLRKMQAEMAFLNLLS